MDVSNLGDTLSALFDRLHSRELTEALPDSLPVPAPAQFPLLQLPGIGPRGTDTTPQPTPVPASVSPASLPSQELPSPTFPAPPAVPLPTAHQPQAADIRRPAVATTSGPGESRELPTYLPPVAGSAGVPGQLPLPAVPSLQPPGGLVPGPNATPLPATGAPGATGRPIPASLPSPAASGQALPTLTPPLPIGGPLVAPQEPGRPALASLPSSSMPSGQAPSLPWRGGGSDLGQVVALLREINVSIQALASQLRGTGAPAKTPMPTPPGTVWSATYQAPGVEEHYPVASPSLNRSNLGGIRGAGGWGFGSQYAGLPASVSGRPPTSTALSNFLEPSKRRPT